MPIFIPRPCFCIICRKETNQLGIKSHFQRVHNTKPRARPKSSTKYLNIERYNQAPKLCSCCGGELSYEQRKNIFCSSSCAAQTNNTGRVVSKETREKLSYKIKQKFKHKPEVVGEYSKLWYANCLHCGVRFYSAKRCLVCPNHQHLKYNHNRHLYSFRFNIYHYPDLFNLNLLTILGWYSPGGNSISANPNGMSRDHKVSVREARVNNYDPYYISHPCNCDLITQKENSTKNSRSSITYEELVSMVDAYDSNRGGI